MKLSTLFIDDDVVIPVVQKKTPLSPSVSSIDSFETRSHSTNEAAVTSPISPHPRAINSPLPSDSPANERPTSSSLIENANTADGANTSTSQLQLLSKMGENSFQTSAPSSPIKSMELRSEKLFYTPDTESSSTWHSLPSKGSANSDIPTPITSVPSPSIPDIVVERRVPDHLPLTSVTNKVDVVTPSSAEGKTPVRRTSSNDSGLLRRSTSKPTHPDLLSP